MPSPPGVVEGVTLMHSLLTHKPLCYDVTISQIVPCGTLPVDAMMHAKSYLITCFNLSIFTCH